MVAKASEIIAQFGGQSALARALGVNQSTVQHWAKTGNIPTWRREQVERAAQTHGLGIQLSAAPAPRSATQTPPPPAPKPTGPIGMAHGRAEFVPNIDGDIGALRDEIAQLKALVARLVEEVNALRTERGASARRGASKVGKARQVGFGKSTSRS